MAIVIIILSIIGTLVLIMLIAAALSPEEYIIETSIVINKPVADVFNYIKYLKNQANYNKWVLIDPNVKKEYKGTDGTVGFFYAWASDNRQLGKGEQEITAIIDEQRVDYDLHFIQPFENRAQAYLLTTAQSIGQTKVTWGFKGKRTFLMKVMHIAFNLKKMLTKDLDASLINLKMVLDKQQN